MKKTIFVEQLEIIDEKELSEKGWDSNTNLGIIGILIAVVALIISLISAKKTKEI